MNTPAHLAASVLWWRKEPGWSTAAAITAGAILPDAPMFAFYAYQKLLEFRSERDIWSKLYFDNNWQLFFDTFNSIPLMLTIMAIGYYFGWRWMLLMSGSALLHLCCDLPLHNDDAHRHFLPFTDWRFASPISYWDPKHHGLVFMVIELVFAIGASLFVSIRGDHRPIRAVAKTNLGLYLLAIIFALTVWAPHLMS